MDEVFLTNEQLKIFLKNQDLIINSLSDRLYRLTGCGDFGNIDSTNGTCIECFYNNRELNNKCFDFKFKNKGEKNESN